MFPICHRQRLLRLRLDYWIATSRDQLLEQHRGVTNRWKCGNEANFVCLERERAALKETLGYWSFYLLCSRIRTEIQELLGYLVHESLLTTLLLSQTYFFVCRLLDNHDISGDWLRWHLLFLKKLKLKLLFRRILIGLIPCRLLDQRWFYSTGRLNKILAYVLLRR